MAKKKDSVALFEVLTRTRQNRKEAGLGVPSWMGSSKPADQAGELQPISPAPEVGAIPADPMVSTADGRLKLSLNYVSCLVAALGLVVLLVLAFWLGHWTGRALGADGPQPPAVGQRPQQPSGQPPPGDQGPTPAVRVSGKYYPVIQGTQGLTQQRYEDAEKIVQYLARNGLQADVRIWRGTPRQYVVWSLSGFDSPQSDEALEFIARVEQLGRKYLAEGGRYGFSQRDRAGRLKPWFIRAR